MEGNEQKPTEEPKKEDSVSVQQLKLYNFSDFSYDTGFADGALRLNAPTHYETFSTNLEKKDLAQQLLLICRQEIARLKTELVGLKQRTLDLYAIVFDREEKLRFTGIQLEEEGNKKEALSREIETLESRRRLIQPENYWIPGIILILAGAVLFLADIFFTQGMLILALSLDVLESWIIAISISFTIFGIKPVIDRVFERPRWEQNKIYRNNTLLIITGILVLIVLALLGYVRIISLQTIASGEVDLEASMSSLNSPALFPIFILASVLFAIVGALCFSMGFRSMEQNYTRLHLAKKRDHAARLLKFQESRIFELHEIEAKYRKELREAQKELELQPLQAQLEMRLAGMESQEKDLMALIAEANSTAQAAWYREGAARGEKFSVSGELYVSPIRMERWVVPEYIKSPSSGGGIIKFPPSKSTDNPVQPLGDYLYQQIRNAIALHDNRTNKKSISNGKPI